MSTSTRLPSGGTIFASSLPSLARIVDTCVGADVAGLGHVDDQIGHPERESGSTISTAAIAIQAAAHPLPVDLLTQGWAGGPAGRRHRGASAAGRAARAAVAASAAACRRAHALTASIGSRRCRRTLVADRGQDRGPPVVGRRAGGGRGAAGPGGRCRGPSARCWGRAFTPSAACALAGICRLTGRGALRYSLAVRAPLRAVWVRREPLGGGTAPST